jgi:hypothetical protein
LSIGRTAEGEPMEIEFSFDFPVDPNPFFLNEAEVWNLSVVTDLIGRLQDF